MKRVFLFPVLLAACVLAPGAARSEDVSPEAAEAFRAAYGEGDREKRLEQVEAVAASRGPVALELLVEALEDADWHVRRAAAGGVAAQERDAAWAAVVAALKGRNPRVRAAAASLAPAVNAKAALKTLSTLQRDRSPAVRAALAKALGAVPYAGDRTRAGAAQVALLGKLARDDSVAVAVAAVEALGQWKTSAAAAGALLRAVPGEAEEVAFRAGEQLQEFERKDIAKQLGKGVRGGTTGQRVNAAVALGALGTDAAARALADCLPSQKWEVRTAVCESLARIAPKEAALVARAERKIVPLLQDSRWACRHTAAWTLACLAARGGLRPMIDAAGRPENGMIWGLLAQMTGQADLGSEARPWRDWYRKNGKTAPLRRCGRPQESSRVAYFGLADTTKSVVFVIDTSRSMVQAQSGSTVSKLEGATTELRKAVGALQPGTRFNVIFFAGRIRVWNRGPLRATWRAKAALQEAVERLRPDGGTNCHGALTAALARHGADTVYFLTDGMPTEGPTTKPAAIVRKITEINHDRETPVRIHCIAFFFREGEGFLSALAKANGGRYRLVQQAQVDGDRR
jgi:HEAT repeat protein